MTDTPFPAAVESIRRRKSDPHNVGPWRPRAVAAHPRHRPRRDRPGRRPHHRRLRLLDLPALRHHHVLLLLRHLRRAARVDGGRAGPARGVRPAARGAGDGGAAAVQLHLRPLVRRHQRQEPAAHPGAAAGHRACSAWSSSALEVTEFIGLAQRASRRSAAASSPASSRWWGCTASTSPSGLLWLGTMMAQLQVKGFRREIMHRLLCFNLFWHALDIVWVGIFSIVYLLGAVT